MQKEIGIALIGSGRWGKNHLKTWAGLGCLKVVCDRNIAALEKLRGEYSQIEFTENLDAVLSREDVRGVVIATPAVTHFDLAIKALEAGKDVLVEKPMALTRVEGEKLVAKANESGRILSVGHVLEYHPAVQKIRELIKDGVLGKIQYIYSNRLNFGSIRTEENSLWSFAPHDIAIMRAIIGSVPTEVACHGGAYISPDVADTTLTNLTFPGNIHGHIFVSWLHPYKVQRFVIVGSKQMAVFDDTRPWGEKLVLFPHNIDWVEGQIPMARKAEGVAIELEEKQPLEEECKHFVHCIQTREKPITSGESGVVVLDILERAQESYQSKGKTL